jgi:hypothetical protein
VTAPREEVVVDDTTRAAALLGAAVRGGRDDVDAVAHEVGASAAADGSPIQEVLDLVERAFDGEPRYASVRAACVGWAEGALGRAHEAGCEDPLTSLSTVPHLHSRLGDVYRAAAVEEQRAGAEHVLVVVEPTGRRPRSGLEASLEALEVGQVLRTVFPGGETVARVGPARFAVLTVRERADATTLALVGVLLGRTPAGASAPRLWVEELPPAADDLPGLLQALGA